MGTTTFDAMRATQMTQIEGLTPTSLAGQAFVRNRAEGDFRDWVDSNPQACFRRFAIADLLDYDVPPTSNTDMELIRGRQEVAIAYPTDYRYGADNLRDRADVMREDMYAIDNVIGHRGYGNYTDGSAVFISTAQEELDNVALLVITYEFTFWRAV